MDFFDAFLTIAETFDDILVKYGPLGIFLAMMAESAGVPFASAIVILTAGKMIASGKITIFSAVFSSVIGIAAGSLFSYSIGYMGKKLGKVINTTALHGKVKRVPYQQTKIKDLYDKYGNFSIVLAQLFGTTRTFISFPAGAMQMNIFLFMLYTTIGGLLYSLAAIAFSMFLNKFMSIVYKILHEILQIPLWVWPLAFLSVIILVLGYLYFRVKNSRKETKL